MSVSAAPQGWNTWNTRSVLSHVLLPCGFALNLGLKDAGSEAVLGEALIGRWEPEKEKIRPGGHAWDGSYIGLEIAWKGMTLRIESAHDGEDLVVLATPLEGTGGWLTVTPSFLWESPGAVTIEKEKIVARSEAGEISVFSTEEPEISEACWRWEIFRCCGLSTGRARSVEEISTLVQTARARHEKAKSAYGDCAELYDAIQTCLAWDTIYDPLRRRMISPVSRLWNVSSGGYVLFCWDNYFAAWMAAIDNKDLAYANAIAITSETTEEGFVPNVAKPGFRSRDRSQPPVGSLVIRELYRKFRDRWLVEEVFDDLLRWNRWWRANRSRGHLLCWGSTPYDSWEAGPEKWVNERFAAALESGLDNSPMYDDTPFDKENHMLELADVGLTSLYAMDCDCLADLADVLGRAEAGELRGRAEETRRALSTLWNEEDGIYLNRRTDSGECERRLSPTHFYPLLTGAPSQDQAERMINEHFFNPAEFAGKWILPSIARNDPAYPEQTYWRGRIWAPMNFLVYLGLRHYALPEARTELVKKSAAVLLEEWREHRHVHENYNAETGCGCDGTSSDRFYHWGGLLGFIALLENGFLAGPEQPL